MSNNILRLPEVKKITGLSRSSIYAMMEKSAFPRQVSLGARAVGWIDAEISEWIAQKVKLRTPVK